MSKRLPGFGTVRVTKCTVFTNIKEGGKIEVGVIANSLDVDEPVQLSINFESTSRMAVVELLINMATRLQSKEMGLTELSIGIDGVTSAWVGYDVPAGYREI